MHLVVVNQGWSIVGVVSIVRSPYSNTLSQVPFQGQVPLLNDRILEVDFRSQIKVIRARLRDVRRIGIWQRILRFPADQVVVREESNVARAHGPSIDRAAAHESLDESSVSAAQHRFVVVTDAVRESDTRSEIEFGRVPQSRRNSHFG